MNVEIVKEQPDLSTEILDQIRQRITRYGQAIASETDEVRSYHETRRTG
jgi:hypothetical protein